MSAEDRGRRRVGLLVPSSNTVMEVDFYRRLPPHATLHTGRMYMERTTPEGESEMLDEHAIPAARAVATALPHVVVFGCTSAGALRGNDYDRAFCERIAEVTGARVVSVIQAVQRAIEAHGAPRVGIVTPYVEALNREIRHSLEAATAAEVVAIHGLGIDENFAIASVSPEDITAFAKRLERATEVILDACPSKRETRARVFLERRLERRYRTAQGDIITSSTKGTKRGAQVVLRHRPVKRTAVASELLERRLIGFNGTV